MKILQSDWFTYDKWAHCLLHVIIVRKLRSLGVHPLYAFLVSVGWGILYEIGDIIYHCFIKKEINLWDYIKDSIKDIVANTIGGVIGLVI